MSSAKNITTFLTIEGRPMPPETRPEIDFRRASTAYFGTMKIPLRRGRVMTEADVASGNRAVVVNESFARRFFPGQDPIGRRISTATISGEGDWQTIVGVVGDVHHAGLDQSPRPEVYYHVDTSPPSGPVFVVRANTDPRSLFPTIRAAVAGLDHDVPVANLATLDELVADSVSPRRVALFLLGAFALLALALAAAGVYGVISFATAQRTREIGIRMALGATRSSIVRMVLGQGGRPIGAGIAVGIGAAAAATRLLSGMLFAVRPIDPITFLAVSVVLASAGVLAALVPARRASRIDPLSALREE
jgi:putative ABC transport system permease protein